MMNSHSMGWFGYSPDGNYFNNIDYILVKRFRTGVNITKIRSSHGVEIGNDFGDDIEAVYE